MIKRCRLYVFLALLASLASAAESADFKVVVNASNSITSVSAKDLSGYFLKKDVTWPDGRAVTAVDLEPDSPTRIEFTTAIHKKKVRAIKSYWQRQIFQGKNVPPMEESTDADVLAFVSTNTGAVGYVSSATALSPKVKELAVEN